MASTPKAKAGLRISGTALELSAEHASSLVRQLGQNAAGHALADRRKTIKDEDVSKAWAEIVG
jgi:histone H3/H4